MIVLVIIIAFVGYAISHALFYAICENYFFPIFWTPKILRNKLKINWFGAVGLYIIYLIICPIFFIGSLGIIGMK